MPDTMPPADVLTEAPLPRSVSWFAPWLWFAHSTPWKRWMVIAVVMVAGYIEAPVLLTPMDYVGTPIQFYEIKNTVFEPIHLACNLWPALGTVYDVQIDAIDTAAVYLQIRD